MVLRFLREGASSSSTGSGSLLGAEAGAGARATGTTGALSLREGGRPGIVVVSVVVLSGLDAQRGEEKLLTLLRESKGRSQAKRDVNDKLIRHFSHSQTGRAPSRCSAYERSSASVFSSSLYKVRGKEGDRKMRKRGYSEVYKVRCGGVRGSRIQTGDEALR